MRTPSHNMAQFEFTFGAMRLRCTPCTTRMIITQVDTEHPYRWQGDPMKAMLRDVWGVPAKALKVWIHRQR